MNTDLAIFGGTPIRTKPFPKYPVIDEKDKKAVLSVLERGELSTFGAGPKGNYYGGKEIINFEKKFSEYNHSKYSLTVNSATAGLHCALAAVGIGPGDEVIVPPYTFTATATSVLMHNAIPVFCDIDPKTYTIDPEKILACIGPKTKAIIPVHLLGHPADMNAIMKIAQEHNLFVIEDCAQAPGAEYDRTKVGNIGHLGVFSFQETKNLPCGEGGMITTNDQFFADRCMMLRNHGETILLDKPRSYISNIIGWNYRMTELEAALGNSQLEKFENYQMIRKELFEHLRQGLSKFSGLGVPYISENVKHAYHIFGLKYDETVTGVCREDIVNAVSAEGIPVSTGYRRPLYQNPIFTEKKGYGNNGCPFSCKFYDNAIDYTSVKCEVAENLIERQAIWIFVARPPAKIDDMEDICLAFGKVWKNIDYLKGRKK